MVHENCIQVTTNKQTNNVYETWDEKRVWIRKILKSFRLENMGRSGWLMKGDLFPFLSHCVVLLVEVSSKTLVKGKNKVILSFHIKY